MRCCVGDEGLALRSRPAGGGFKPPHAALAEDRRGERCGKGARRGVRWGPGRRSLLRCRKRRDDIETGAVFRAPGGAWRVPADWPGGVRHEGDASLVCGFCVERGKACPDMAIRPRGGGREGASQAADTVRD
jgi:hypothetical protein